MNELAALTLATGLDTLTNVAPIVAVLATFQGLVLRRPMANPHRLALGCLWVLIGLTLFLVGLHEALFPLGRTMATQLAALAAPAADHAARTWTDFVPVYAFAAAIGFATAIAEPALIAVALKASQVSAGTIPPVGLRIAVALGAGAGAALGTVRIVLDLPIAVLMVICYGLIVLQTTVAPRPVVPIAYDLGGVTTSTVTVPVIAALGLGLASALPGRSPLLDGFGLIAFTCMCPIICVLAYATVAQRLRRRPPRKDAKE